jgi:hypothetical protein
MPALRTDKELMKRSLAIGLVRRLPPTIADAVLEVEEFRQAFEINLSAVISFGSPGLSFDRSKLFAGIRDVLEPQSRSVELETVDKVRWTLSLNQAGELSLSQDGKTVPIPDFVCLSPDPVRRLEWFDREAEKFQWRDERAQLWRAKLAARAAEDEEIDALLQEFRLTPSFVIGQVANELRGGRTVDIEKIVPNDIRYYDRLVGAPGEISDLKSFLDAVAVPLMREWSQDGPSEGLLRCLLLSSHPFFAQATDITSLTESELVPLYEWLADRGDRISQVGAIECGLAQLHRCPRLAPHVSKLIQAFLDDSPTSEDGRLRLTFALIVFVDGEIARNGIARRRPPFWRRLASIAHASILERQVIAAGIPPSFMIDLALKTRGQLYYLQSFIDLRREPRWLPDSLLPAQLRAEFLGRIAAAGAINTDKISDSQIRAQVIEPNGGDIQRQLIFPYPYLPGPLEGGTPSVLEMPVEIEASVRADLEIRDLTARSFVALVNSSFLYRIGPQLVDLAAEALRKAQYQLRQKRDTDASFALLMGLACVAAVARNGGLATEVRILARVMRRSLGVQIETDNAMRIAFVAAAAFSDAPNWSKFVGEWLTELAFEDMDRDQAESLRTRIKVFCQLEPLLWETCGRAEAALAAFLLSTAVV